MTRRELATWLLLWTTVATAVAIGIVAGALVVLAIHPGAVAASRPAQQADSPQLPGEMTTEGRRTALPLPDFAGRTGQPDSHPGAPTAQPVLGRITPSPTTGKRPASTEAPETAASLSGIASMPAVDDAEARTAAGTIYGIATWFDSPAGVSAAGPNLRAALGPGWRGTTVTVCVGDRCVVTVLGDWCACGPRPGGPTVIDLDAYLFARLAPLPTGVLPIEVSW